jgi:hypothetical protein
LPPTARAATRCTGRGPRVRRAPGINLSIYGRGVLHLVRHPSVFAMPLLAALIDMLVSYTSGVVTDPLGGFGIGIFQMIVQVLYLFAFGVAVIQASAIERGRRATFDDAWEEARPKAGGIILAAIGFQFVVWVAAYAGSFLGGYAQLALQVLAYIFLIFTIPAAAIGGLPGSLAISGSIRAVRANAPAAIVLALVFVVLWIGVPYAINAFVAPHLGFIAYELSIALARAIVLGYLAFPFASAYDEIAFRGYW